MHGPDEEEINAIWIDAEDGVVGGDRLEGGERSVAANREVPAPARRDTAVGPKDGCALGGRDLRELHGPRSASLDERSTVGRAHVLHPIGSVAKHRHEVALPSMLRRDEHDRAQGAGRSALHLQRDQERRQDADPGEPRYGAGDCAAESRGTKVAVEEPQVASLGGILAR